MEKSRREPLDSPEKQEKFDDQLRVQKVKGQLVEEVQQMQHQELFFGYPLLTSPHTPKSEWFPVFKRILEETPNQPIAIPQIKRGLAKEHPLLSAKRKSVRYRDKVPFFYTAFKIHTNRFVNGFIVLLLCVNIVASIYLAQEDEEDHPVMFQVLRSCEVCFVAVYGVDVALWIVAALAVYGSEAFLADTWLTFDLVCYLLSVCPPGIVLMFCATWNYDMMEVAERIKWLYVLSAVRVFRILPRVKALRKATTVMVSATRAILFLLIFITLVMIIVAVVGMALFYDFTIANNSQFEYQYKFATFPSAFATVFQLTTFDSWTSIYHEVSQVVPPWTCAAYFVGWVWVGAFVFSNIFVGIMVDEVKKRTALEAEKEPRRKERQRVLMMERQQNKSDSHKFSPQLELHGKELASKLHKKLDDLQVHEMAVLLDARVDTLDPRYKRKLIDRSKKCRKKVITPLTRLGVDCQSEWTNREIYKFYESMGDVVARIYEMKRHQTIPTDTVFGIDQSLRL